MFGKPIIFVVIYFESPVLPCSMQVEVSKYTEGLNDKALRPNGLPRSLIHYDGKKSG